MLPSLDLYNIMSDYQGPPTEGIAQPKAETYGINYA